MRTLLAMIEPRNNDAQKLIEKLRQKPQKPKETIAKTVYYKMRNGKIIDSVVSFERSC